MLYFFVFFFKVFSVYSNFDSRKCSIRPNIGKNNRNLNFDSGVFEFGCFLIFEDFVNCSDFIGVSYGVVISFVKCFISLCFSSRFLVFTAILIHENAPLDLTLVKITEILTIVNGENSFKGYRLLTDIFNGKIGEKYIKNVGKLDERIDELENEILAEKMEF